jgi:hypothetical protein
VSETPITLLMTLTVPRLLTERYPTPSAVKRDLVVQRIWPERVTQERWRPNLSGGGYIIDLEIAARLPGGGHAP